MHVLVTADTVGGVWTYTRELVTGLLDHGHTVTLVSFGRMPTNAQAAWTKRKNLTYFPTEFPLEWMQDSQEGIVDSANYLDVIIRNRRPDILHFNQFCYGALECGIPKVVVAHSDVVSWWHAVHDSHPPQSAWMDWYKTLVTRGLRCADAVVAPSRWMLETIHEHYAKPLRAQVIHNGRNAEHFRPSPRKNDCVLSVGRVWDEAKQISLLLSRKHPVPVRIAGSIAHPEKLASDGVCLQLGENCTFCGEQDETQLCELYSDAATYAATSRYEPFGLAPVEAALSQCALIANDIPVFHELWGDSAFYFKRNDPDSLADAIATVSSSASMRQRLAQQSYEHARICFSADRMVAQYEALYCELAPGGRG